MILKSATMSNTDETKAILRTANALMKSGQYKEALQQYKDFQSRRQTLRKSVIANIELCERRDASSVGGNLHKQPAIDSALAAITSTEITANQPSESVTVRQGGDDHILRNLEPLAPLAVVINALNSERWGKACSILMDLSELQYDAYIMGSEQLDIAMLTSGVRSITYLGPADEPGNARGFVRSANTTVFSGYEAILWISPSDSHEHPARDPGYIVKQANWFLSAHNCGWASDERHKLDLQTREGCVDTLNGINLILHRIGLSYGDPLLDCPIGSVVLLKPILLSVLRAALRLAEMQEKGAKTWNRNTILGLLAIVARKSGMENGIIPHTSGQSLTIKSRKVKTIAFFLPQFHPIPENDKWWGKGFTEWANVTRAKPLFRYHYQPRLPSELGFYDLRLEETQVAQAELAHKFGIHGFCYYYYWFNGKKLLNQPIEQMARSSLIEVGFCVCWANENWSRNWDGQNRHVLMKQDYSLESNIALMRNEMIPMMKDPRWIRHNGKPLMVVYRISIIPNWIETARAWREECRNAGLGEIHLCAVRFGLETLDGQPKDFDLDSYVLFPPHEAPRKDLRQSVLDLHKDFSGEIFDYTAVVDGDLKKYANGYDWPVHRGAMLGWDNTARRLTDARVFHGATPFGFRRWIKGIVEQEAKFNTGPESLIFINAWNEWAEGTYLEPDQRWGTTNLEALASGLRAVPGAEPVPIAKGTAARSTPEQVLVRQGSPLVMGGAALAPPVCHAGALTHDRNLPTVLLCAHISGHHLFGGERSLLDVLDALSMLPLNVVVTLPSGNNKTYLSEISKRSIATYVFAYPQWMNNRETYGWLSNTFADIIARHGVDIVHANTIVLSEPVIAARRMGRQSLIHVRELISLDEPLRDRMALPTSDIVAEVCKRADWLICNSEATCKLFAKGDRTIYVPNAVSLPEFDMGNKFGNIIKFGIVSSNIPKKGVADFIEVARRAAPLVSRARFVVIGPKNEQIDQWEAEVRTGERPDNLVFLGYRDTPRAAISELNVLMNLSHFAESFGRTLAEACAARRPVIAYEWGALPELVRHGETGILVTYRDIEAVVAAVKMLCDNSNQITKMGEAGRAFITQNFSQSALRESLAKGYEKVLKRPMCSEAKLDILGGAPNSAASLIGYAPSTTIIIPVFNAPEEVRVCLSSVIKHTDRARDRILVIDDGSSDPEIAPILAAFDGTPGLKILRNRGNNGYTKTINLGISEADEDDVVLLNSDTIVTPKWLEGLRATAYSRPKVATVTAMSDNAGAFSFPTFNETCRKPEHLSHEEYALMVLQQTQDCIPPEVPTGSGFCMFIRRTLLGECGLFDNEAFPRGYGEENDFCMRALNAGWLNLVSPWSFVYHIRTASFKGEKAALVKAGVDIVTKRYPDYASAVKSAFAAPDMLALRVASGRIVETR